MFGFMRVSTHKKALQIATAIEVQRQDHERAFYNRAIAAEQAISNSLRDEIEEMRPIYELGKKRRAAYDRNNADRKAKRTENKVGL